MEKKQILVQFGKTVQELRKKAGYSQESFADHIGVHRTYVGMIERAEKNITLLNIEKIAKGLEISVSELMRKL